MLVDDIDSNSESSCKLCTCVSNSSNKAEVYDAEENTEEEVTYTNMKSLQREQRARSFNMDNRVYNNKKYFKSK